MCHTRVCQPTSLSPGSAIVAPQAERHAALRALTGGACSCNRCALEASLPEALQQQLAELHARVQSEWAAALEAAAAAEDHSALETLWVSTRRLPRVEGLSHVWLPRSRSCARARWAAGLHSPQLPLHGKHRAGGRDTGCRRAVGSAWGGRAEQRRCGHVGCERVWSRGAGMDPGGADTEGATGVALGSNRAAASRGGAWERKPSRNSDAVAGTGDSAGNAAAEGSRSPAAAHDCG